jgi:hypothetical protein
MTFLEILFRSIERSKVKFGAVEVSGLAAILAVIILSFTAIIYAPSVISKHSFAVIEATTDRPATIAGPRR